MSADRLTQLRAKLKASTDYEGKPLPSYAERVAALKREIERLEQTNV